MTKRPNLEEIEARCEAYLAHYPVASDDLRALLATDIPALVKRVRGLEAFVSAWDDLRKVQFSITVDSRNEDRVRSLDEARRLLDGGK